MIEAKQNPGMQSATPRNTAASGHDWLALKSTYRLSNGADLACITQGEPDQPALLLIHGFTDSSRTWVGMEQAFATHNRIMPDLRGHGQSCAPDYGYSLSHFVDDLRLLLAQLEVRECVVVGHSLGGMVAQLLAATFPDLVSKLVLIGTTATPGDGSVSELKATIDTLTAPIDPEGPFMQQWYGNPGAVDEAFLTQLRAEAARIPLHVLKGVIQATSMTDMQQIGADISADTLILWGDADPFFDRVQQEKMRDAISGSQLIALGGLGHNPHWEEPAKIIDLIHEFLNR